MKTDLNTLKNKKNQPQIFQTHSNHKNSINLISQKVTNTFE